MTGKTIKFSPDNALYLSNFLTALNPRELPPAFEFGKKADKYTLLSCSILDQDNCPFKDAKESTVTQWIKNIFSGVELLDTHISNIEASETSLNMDELREDIVLKNGDITQSLELIAAEWDVQKYLNLVLPAPASKAVHAITASAIKNAVDCKSVLEKLCSLRQIVTAFKLKEKKKLEKIQEDRKRKRAAEVDLVNPELESSVDESETASSSSNDDDEESESQSTPKKPKKDSKKNKKGKDKKPKKSKKQKQKKKKPEGPTTLGEGQTTEKTVSQVIILTHHWASKISNKTIRCSHILK